MVWRGRFSACMRAYAQPPPPHISLFRLDSSGDGTASQSTGGMGEAIWIPRDTITISA